MVAFATIVEGGIVARANSFSELNQMLFANLITSHLR